MKSPGHMPDRSSSQRVAITAVGVVSPLGTGVAATTEALKNGRDCVSPITSFDVARCRAKTAGQVRDLEIADCGLRKERLHPASKMMIAAMREAAEMDRSFIPDLVVVGTTSGGMSFGEQFYRAQIANQRPRKRGTWLANYLPHKPVLDAQEACGFSAPSQIIANACASGTNAIGHAFSLIRGGHMSARASAAATMRSPNWSSSASIRCKPRRREGFVLSIETAPASCSAKARRFSRWKVWICAATRRADSRGDHRLRHFHRQPSSHPAASVRHRAAPGDGARAPSAAREPSAIDYINAHGTATTFNDATEGAAIVQLFSGESPPVSSTKSMMGHALGAAGAIEAVFSVLALRDQFLPPNINYGTADPTWSLDIVANEAREARVECVLSNSFGFGGTNASIVIERTDAAAA